MASEQQKAVRLFLFAASVALVATWGFSKTVHLHINPDSADGVSVEWESETGTPYTVYWSPDLSEHWRYVGECEATGSMTKVKSSLVSNKACGFYVVRESVAVVVSNDITSDTVWSPMSGPYVLTGMVSVVGANLSIKSGTEVRCLPGSGLAVTDGVLHVAGATDAPVRFVPWDCSEGAGPWRGISVEGSGGRIISISNAVIEGAATGLRLVGGTGELENVTVRGCTNGAISIESFTGTVSRCMVVENRAVDGAGLLVRNSRLLVRECLIASNCASAYQADAHGGGLFCGSGSFVTIQRSRFIENQGWPAGGGIYAAEGRVLVQNSLFARNSAIVGAAGYFGAVAAQVENCTIVQNSGNAVYGEVNAPNMVNDIVWGNEYGVAMVFGSSGVSVLYCRLQDPWPGTGNSIGDPGFFFGTYELRKDSACVDMALDLASLTNDLNGRARWDVPALGQSVVDIGACEYIDDDRDGLADIWEIGSFGSVDVMDGAGDSDEEGPDGLSNVDEIDRGTDPFRADSDGDGLSDGDEVHEYQTDPLKMDTDGDGATDAYELRKGTDPLDPGDTPVLPRPVINEVMHRPITNPACYYQFIELYNPCDDAIEIGGCSIEVLHYGKVRSSVAIPAGASMGPTSFYLIGGPFVSTIDGQIPDLMTNMTLRLEDGEGGPAVKVALKNSQGMVIDGLLYGQPYDGSFDANGCSTPPEPASGFGFSIARAVDGYDSNRTSDWRSVSNYPSPRGSGHAPAVDPDDIDRDGLTIAEEEALGTDPLNPDSDGDELRDGDEVQAGLNPATIDSDGDGLWDNEELDAGFNPTSNDTDGDGLWDGIELGLGLSPINSDSDANGVLDGDEDADDDGFTNKAEQDYGSDPMQAGSNPSGMPGSSSAYWDRGAAGEVNCDVMPTVDLMLDDGRPVKDYKRETDMVFYDVHRPTPVFITVIERRYGRGSYYLKGARMVHHEKSLSIFAALIPRGGATITLVEQLTSTNGGRFGWPRLRVLKPVVFNVRAAGQIDSESGGRELFIGLNDDDDDGDFVADVDDDDVSTGDDDMAYVEITHAKRMPLQLDWDDDIIHVYENRHKKLLDRHTEEWMWSASVGACIPNEPYKGWDDGKLYIEGVRPGWTWLTISSGGFTRRIKVTVVDTSMTTDFNHDRVVDEGDFTRAEAGEPFRFWVNDDDDVDAVTGDDIPGRAQPDHGNNVVDSVRDLVDFFPLVISIPDELRRSNLRGCSFVLRHSVDGLNLVHTRMTAQDVGSYLVDEETATSLGSRRIDRMEEEGYIWLAESDVDRLAEEGSIVLLAESGAWIEAPLWLEVQSPAGKVISSNSLSLSIMGVEEMYSHINLRPSGGLPSTDGVPPNMPNSTSDKNIVFVHGFACNGEGARGWHAEVFKRLYWSGSRARFWGVTWQGDIGLVDGLHYQADVANSLAVAANLSEEVGLIDGDRIVMAHSLGNMLVSGAIQDYGLTVSKYLMLNAAVASECYDPAMFDDGTNGNHMLHEDWAGYNSNTWCSTWFRLFLRPDDRARLTWRGRFTAVPSVAYNFYSSGDEVFQVYPGTPGRFTGGPFHLEQYAWQKQEIFKGCGGLGGTDWAGWGFESHWEDRIREPEYTLAQANAASEDNLRTNAVFWHEPAAMFAPSIAAQTVNDVIAQGVPAMSHAAGVTNALPGFDRNYDMNAHKQNGWGRNELPYNDRWLHSDLKDMVYLYTYGLFDEVVVRGGLQ